MVFNATFNNISVISWRHTILRLGKGLLIYTPQSADGAQFGFGVPLIAESVQHVSI